MNEESKQVSEESKQVSEGSKHHLPAAYQAKAPVESSVGQGRKHKQVAEASRLLRSEASSSVGQARKQKQVSRSK